MVLPAMFLAAIATLSAQAPAESPPRGRTEVRPCLPADQPPSPYEQLLARYASADDAAVDAAVDAVATKPAVEFDAPLNEAWIVGALRAKCAARQKSRSRIPLEWHKAQDRVARLMVAAMLLHTEAALMTSADQVTGHLDLARRAAQSLEDVKAEHHSPGSGFIGPEQVAQIVHEWHVLAGSVLVARGTGNVVYQFITKALQRYTNDPDLHLALGIYFERDANDGVVDVSLVRDIYMPETVSSWRGALESAVDHYKEALKTESSLEEAQLRLGRVDTLLGERRKAEAALTPLATGARNPSIRYLALLFLAELADAQGRREPAQSRYLEALVLYPEAQAPMLALSCLQDQAGDDVGARAWLERSLNAVNSKRLDPWWLYGKAPVSRFNDMIGALRKYLRP